MKSYFFICLFLDLFLLQCANASFPIELGDRHNLFEGDIQLPAGRNGILATKKWTNGVIPYEWSNKTNWGPRHKDMMSQVMKEIEKHTCVRFVPRSTQENYVRIINGTQMTGCSSSVGQNGGMQELSLEDTDCCGSCWYPNTVVHEVLHAVGLWHEQSRYDRDNFITVHTENVAKDLRYNFYVQNQSTSNTYGVDYNYYSIMHYPKNIFSMNGGMTIETKDPEMMDVIGKQKQAHENDYEKIRRIYDCTATFPTMPPPPGSICEDTLPYCNKSLDKCGKEAWTKINCRKSCGFCKPVDLTCKDSLTYCWKQADKCKEEWAKTSCRKTCRYC